MSTVHLAASLGGHLELLERITPALDGRRRVWITSEGARAQSLRQRGEEVRTLPRLDRSSMTPASLAAGARLALRERPSTIVTSGAGIAVPFALTGRALGARVIFLETMARVTSGSMTGRILSRVAAEVLVQWPELLRAYPTARLCQPILLEGVTRVGDARGEGTFVTVGSHDMPFDRLLDAVKAAAEAGVLPAPVRAQVGVGTVASPAVETMPFVSPEEFRRHVETARVVICHGGAGALAAVLRASKRPLVMARRTDRHEHVDDHQLDLSRKLERLGLVVSIEHEITPTHVAAVAQPRSLSTELATRPTVVDELRAVLCEGS
jgi:UDP-N-acetylglucosamine--N-acetylmuramyl-(pentapeptide) pyrophosphoryl-undecaprenol N-acetylglucosamine transferase